VKIGFKIAEITIKDYRINWKSKRNFLALIAAKILFMFSLKMKRL
jgi:hypothetical protein